MANLVTRAKLVRLKDGKFDEVMELLVMMAEEIESLQSEIERLQSES